MPVLVCADSLTRIRDIARPLGERNNKLLGWGLVVGLDGTGDGGDVLITARPLLAMLQKLGNPPQSVQDLKQAKNVAVVMVTAEMGRNGNLNGDKIDVRVSSLGKAKSLAGGNLLPCPLRSSNMQDDSVYAWASGAISLPDKNHKTAGVIKGGAEIEDNFVYSYISRDEVTGEYYFDLVLDDDQANWQSAKAVAMEIEAMNTVPGSNQEQVAVAGAMGYERSAYAISPRDVRVKVPDKQALHPADYIARVMNLVVDLPNPEATIVINEKTGTIAITGNVEITPCTVHVPGLVIRIAGDKATPSGAAGAGVNGQPVVKQSEWSRFDTTGSKRNDIDDLTAALDQLNVPVQEKINAIYALRDIGALRARIIKE